MNTKKYRVMAECTNCLCRSLINVFKGKRVSDAICPYCECKGMEAIQVVPDDMGEGEIIT